MHLDSNPGGRWSLLRWLISAATLNFPQAASPVAFSLLALSLTGDTSGGAAMILTMTLAQVAGVIPITQLGTSRPATQYLRILVILRSLALIAIAIGAWYGVSFTQLVVLAGLAGLVNGAAHGYLRVILNHLVSVDRLPRALGIAATLNELTFVLAPVVASGLGIISPPFAILVITLLSTLPAILIPDTGSQHAPDVTPVKGRTFSLAISLWLVCAASSSAVVASIEIGAVALALSFNYTPAFAVLFTVPLCSAAVAGGIWVSIRNRMSSPKAVVVQLAVMAAGSVMAALQISLTFTVLGTLLIGSVMAPLATHYSLVLDVLAPPHKRAEVFALQRTANAMGIIIASAVLTVMSLSTALVMVTGIIMLATIGVGIASTRNISGPDKKAKPEHDLSP